MIIHLSRFRPLSLPIIVCLALLVSLLREPPPVAGESAPGGEAEGDLSVRIRIHSERLSEVPISRFITGNFIEKGFGRQVTGMWAEMIYNRSFQEVPPYKPVLWNSVQLNPEFYHDEAPFWHSGYEEHDWKPIGADHTVLRRSMGRNPFKGRGSLELVNDTAGENSGLRQKGLIFRRGVVCRFELFAGVGGSKTGPSLPGFPPVGSNPGEPRTLKIRLLDEREGGRLFSHEFELTSVPGPFSTDIELGDFEGRATLEIVFDWKGTLVLAWCSLMPTDHQGGWRSDVLTCLKAAAPPVIRYPGGCFASFSDWRHAVGPRAGRPALESFFWGGLEENDVGIDEFLDLCRRVGCEPQICINMMTSTPSRAAELVEYCNGPDDSLMGRFRRENGIARQGRVRLWEMDNEAGRKWSPLQYARETVRFAAAMREVDPDIEVMMEYYSWSNALEWLPQMLEIAGPAVDYVVHRTLEPEFYRKALAVLGEYNRKNGTRIRHANTEWVASYDAPEPFDDPELKRTHRWEDITFVDYKRSRKYRQNRWFYALNAASTLLDFMALGGEFYLANFNNCVNTWGQNIIEASKEGAWLSPAGRVFQFFRNFDARFPLVTEAAGVDPALIKALACETERGLHLYVLNLGTRAVTARLDGSALVADAAVLETLSAPDRLSRARFGGGVITCSREDIDVSGGIRLAPLSLNRLTFQR